MKTDAELIAALIKMSNELANRGISAMKVLSAHINSIRARDPVNGRIVSALKKPAPLGFSSGAPVAQTECATGEFVLTGKPSGAKARHCCFASGAAAASWGFL